MAKGGADTEEVLAQLRYMLDIYETKTLDEIETNSIGHLINDTLDALNTHEQTISAIKTGFEEYDKLTNGLLPGELLVVAGRPGMGKTVFLVNLMLRMAKENPILFCSLDLSANLMAARFIAAKEGIAAENFLLHKLTRDNINDLLRTREDYKDYKIQIIDRLPDSFKAFMAFCRKKISEEGIKVLVLDYLQLLGIPAPRYSRESEIAYFMREFKKLARETNVSIVLASQLSRAVEMRGGSKKPLLADLRDSGTIEQDADKVLFLYRPEYYYIQEDEMGNCTEGVIELILAKNRNGRTGTAFLMRNECFSTLVDYKPDTVEFKFFNSKLNDIDNEIDPIF